MKRYIYLLLHFIFILGVYLAYQLIFTDDFGDNLFPSHLRLANTWDAFHYKTIMSEGYSFDPKRQSNVAFFPAFPYLWKLLHVNAFGISIINILLLYLGVGLMMKHFKISSRAAVLFLSLPPLFYLYLPYSESLFLVFTFVLLLGLKRDNIPLVMLGIFLCCVTRSAANIFVPAIVLMGLLQRNFGIKRILLYSLTTILSIGPVILLHYRQTGAWFGYFQTQKHWGHKLRVPDLPFVTWGKYVWLDGAALFVGCICILAIIYFFYRAVIQKQKADNGALIFSLLFISGLTAFSVLYKGGSLYSLNRYIIPTGFFFLAMSLFYRFKLTNLQAFFVLIGTFIFTIPFHFFTHIRVILPFIIMAVYFAAWALSMNKNKRIANIAFALLYVSNCAIQVFLLDRFWQGYWVG